MQRGARHEEILVYDKEEKCCYTINSALDKDVVMISGGTPSHSSEHSVFSFASIGRMYSPGLTKRREKRLMTHSGKSTSEHHRRHHKKLMERYRGGRETVEMSWSRRSCSPRKMKASWRFGQQEAVRNITDRQKEIRNAVLIISCSH